MYALIPETNCLSNQNLTISDENHKEKAIITEKKEIILEKQKNVNGTSEGLDKAQFSQLNWIYKRPINLSPSFLIEKFNLPQVIFEMTIQFEHLNTNFEECEMLAFSQIKNQSEMIDFLLNSKSFYHKLCGACLKYQDCFSYNEQSEKHHIFPQFLIKTGPLTENWLEQSFNFIVISTSFHFFIHILRFLEFKN